MKYIKNYIIFLLILLFACAAEPDIEKQIQEFFIKKNVTILVTDSGFGGLSVAADVAERLPHSGVFQNVRVVFFNSLFHNKSGYNSLKQEKQKAKIFDAALNAMYEKYDPDLLLIACNTLSVVYENTRFKKHAPFPVLGIVGTGVDVIAEHFDEHPDATAILFGTKTTIGSNAHKKRLTARGYQADQIVGQACHKLAGAIERGFESDETREYLEKYVAEAVNKLENKNAPIFASFNCTHYGYVTPLFIDAFARHGYPDVAFLDPNPAMADFMFDSNHLHRYDSTRVTIKVVAKTSVSDEKMTSLTTLLQRTSPATTQALRDYVHDPSLFHADFDTTTIRD